MGKLQAALNTKAPLLLFNILVFLAQTLASSVGISYPESLSLSGLSFSLSFFSCSAISETGSGREEFCTCKIVPRLFCFEAC